MQEPNDYRLSTLLDEYLRANRRIESSTVDLTKRAWRELIELAGDMQAKDFNMADEFQSFYVNTGRAETTANIRCKSVRPVFNWAVKKGYIETDPFEDLKLFRIGKPIVHIYTTEQVKAMLEHCNLLWICRILLAKTAAMRRGEILNLTIGDIDFNKGIVYVQPKKETETTWKWQPKDKDIRELPLVPELNSLLVKLMLNLPEGQPYLMLLVERYKRLIELKQQGKLADRIRKCPDENWEKPWTRILKRAEIKNGTFHDLRRTCITEWLENGLQPHQVMKLAGHSDIDTTLVYYTAYRQSLLTAARNISAGLIQIGARGLEPARIIEFFIDTVATAV